MRLTNVPNAVVACHKAQTALHLVSQPGMGKSETIEVATKALLEKVYGGEVGVVTYYMAQIDAPDVRGFMVPTKTPDGMSISVYTVPDIVMAVRKLLDAGCVKVILFLDERNQADHLVQKAIAPVILDLRVGDHQLPRDRVVVVSASNRVQDGSGVNKPLKHTINREATVEVDFNVNDLIQWGEAHNVHPMMLTWWKQNPGDIAVSAVPKDDKPFTSPRTQTMAGKVMVGMMDDPNSMFLPSDSVTQELVAGLVGDAVAAKMFSFFKVAGELPEFGDIVRDPMTAKLPPVARMDAQYAAMSMCTYHADPTNVDQAFTYITRLSKELQTTAAKSLLQKKGGGLLNSPVLSKFVAENKALIMSTIGA